MSCKADIPVVLHIAVNYYHMSTTLFLAPMFCEICNISAVHLTFSQPDHGLDNRPHHGCGERLTRSMEDLVFHMVHPSNFKVIDYLFIWIL